MTPANEPFAVGTGMLANFCDVDTLNSLLRGEISAVETYDQALAKFDEDAAGELRTARDDHRRAVAALRDKVRNFGGDPADGSGTWGTFATAVTGAAKVIGPKTVLSALKQGEEHGVGEYQEALDNPEIADECRFLIRSELLPNCNHHITTLARMIEALEAK